MDDSENGENYYEEQILHFRRFLRTINKCSL